MATSRNNATEKDARHGGGGACSAVVSTNLRSQKKTKDGGKL